MKLKWKQVQTNKSKKKSIYRNATSSEGVPSNAETCRYLHPTPARVRPSPNNELPRCQKKELASSGYPDCIVARMILYSLMPIHDRIWPNGCVTPANHGSYTLVPWPLIAAVSCCSFTVRFVVKLTTLRDGLPCQSIQSPSRLRESPQARLVLRRHFCDEERARQRFLYCQLQVSRRHHRGGRRWSLRRRSTRESTILATIFELHATGRFCRFVRLLIVFMTCWDGRCGLDGLD